MRTIRLLFLAGLTTAAVPCGTVPADDDTPAVVREDRTIDPDVLADVEDLTPLERPEEQAARAALLEHAVATPADDLRARTRRHLRTRRREHGEAAGPVETFDPFADAVAHPQAWRGKPLIVWGRVLEGSELVAVRGAEVVRVALHDDAERSVLLLLPAETPTPAPGTPLVGVGPFLKLVGTRTEPLPVVVAGGLTILKDRLDPWLMQSVDNLARPAGEERDAYLTAIAQARMADVGRLRKLARLMREQRVEATNFSHEPATFPTFVDLFKSLDFEGRKENPYQGRPVTLGGHVWSISKEPADAAEYGVEHLYSLLLYTDDSQTIPALVVCTELPDGLPTSGPLDEAVERITVTGFAYKMLVYDDQRGEARKMPVIVARTVTWNPPPDVPPLEMGVVGYVVAGVLALLMVLAWWVTRRDRRTSHLRRETDGEPKFDNVSEEDKSPSDGIQ